MKCALGLSWKVKIISSIQANYSTRNSTRVRYTWLLRDSTNNIDNKDNVRIISIKTKHEP